MVLKKTNCYSINSGNTMRKCLYTAKFRKNISQTCHILRIVKNVNGNDNKEELVDAASCYLEDGLSMTSTHSNNFFGRLMMSLNKRKRWLLEESVAEAMKDKDLAAEPFKVTLVHRAATCRDDHFRKYHFDNVERYYDSHISKCAITPNKRYSSRQGLIAKGQAWQETEVKRRSRKKKLGHNQHFRGTQRKQTWGPFFEKEETENADTVTPEIRYETVEPQKLNSESFSSYPATSYWTWYDFSRKRMRFRGSHRDRLSWYCMNSGWTKGTSQHDQGTDVIEDEEDLETSSDCEDYSVPAKQEFSLLDWAAATQGKKSRASKKNTGKVNNRKTETSRVNSASSQLIHKQGKNSVIFIQQEEEKEVEPANDELHSQTAEADSETDDHNRLEVETPLSAFDYAAEFTKYENSFCSCKVLQCEFSARYLRNVLGSVVEIGNCIPFTARFNIQAASVLLENRTMETGEHEWWLLCQVGEKATEQFSSTLHFQEVVINVNLRLYSSHDSNVVVAANQGLLELVMDAGQKEVFISFTTLLLRVCQMLQGQLALHRLDTQTVQVLKSQDTYVPYEPYMSKVTVCNITQAFHHLKAAGKVSLPQVTEDPDLDSVCSLTWCDLECVICYNRFDEDDAVTERELCPFVIISTCGHCFCLQCWQHHLVRKVMEGQTSLNCMEYKCGTSLDVTAFMSMVPQWVFARWLHLVQSRAVESSGEWKWCPNARCNLLATSMAVGKKTVKGSGTSVGVPVRCKCQTLWCLDCGKDAHWPVYCTQFDTYTKMLRQKGDEHGRGSATEIAFVQVKRCPGCNYPLEKSGGCSHMTCSQCPMHFCWECLVDWTEHVSSWFGCKSRAEETIELSNDKIYPLPIECYQKAVSFRHKRMQIQRVRHSNIRAYSDIYDFLQDLKGKRAVVTLSEDAVSYVMEAHLFVEKTLTLLELSYILLSNASRSDYRLQKPLRNELQLLEFFCERLMEHLQLPKKKVLLNAESLHKMSISGQRLILRICFRCHNLTSQIHGTRAQEWLLTTDHERFVKYK